MACSRISWVPRRPPPSRRTPRKETESTSFASTPVVRRKMQLQSTRDTAPELAVRRLLHAWGFRYRVDVPPIPSLGRRADLVFGPTKVAVFVDGCFWHGCPEHGRRAHRVNADFWNAKIMRNRARDQETDDYLAAAGWIVVRAWEHEDPAEVARRIADTVLARRSSKQSE